MVWSFRGFGIGVMEKRLADVGSIRWMRIQLMRCCATLVQAGWRRARVLMVNLSWRAGPGTRLIHV